MDRRVRDQRGSHAGDDAADDGEQGLAEGGVVRGEQSDRPVAAVDAEYERGDEVELRVCESWCAWGGACKDVGGGAFPRGRAPQGGRGMGGGWRAARVSGGGAGTCIDCLVGGGILLMDWGSRMH